MVILNNQLISDYFNISDLFPNILINKRINMLMKKLDNE